jgi:predicted DNA helicase
MMNDTTSEDIQNEIKKLLVLLKKEKEADLAHYLKKTQSTSLKERRKQGVCWYPAQLEKTRIDTGERLIVKISRLKEHNEAHMFQSGKLVSVFSNNSGVKDNDEAINGVINQVKKTEMFITLNNDSLPEWLLHGQFGVQLLFDENAYREMERTLFLLLDAKEERLLSLKNVLLGSRSAHFSENQSVIDIGLNESQNQALHNIYNAQDLAIIHGPPGTGKTTTIVQAILHTLKSEKQILVCAPSNAAVDLLVEKLGMVGIEVLRIGHPARVTEEVLSQTLDAKIAKHPDYREMKTLLKKSEEYYRLAKQHKRQFGQNERKQRGATREEAKSLKEQAKQLSYYITQTILDKAQVIAATLVGANNQILRGRSFETVFIDEAAQALEPACWIPILKAKRVVFAGDHWQLPPTVKSFDAAREGLEVTLFEKTIQRNQADVMLQEQYRMNEKIMNFSSTIFYKNKLIANEQVRNWSLFKEDQVVEFIDTAGCGFFEAVDRETRSSFNTEEANILSKHMKHYISQLEMIGKLEELESIGVISPYKAQVNLLQEMLLEPNNKMGAFNLDKMAINTVDSFQGQERDVIYISLVRSNEVGEIGFLKDTLRMNVAMTRAKKKLVVIGDSATIGQHSFYAKFLDYINEIDAYHSAFEWMGDE